MRKLLSLIILLLLFSFGVQSQSVRFGLKGGLYTHNLAPSDFNVFDEKGLEHLGISLKDAKYGIHAGALLQIPINKFIITPEVVFNSYEAEYEVTDLATDSTNIFKEKYQHLDIPLMLGFKFGSFRIQGGPVGHVFIDSYTELKDLRGYEQKFSELTFGWQAGIGLDLGKLLLEFRYEGNFSKFGDHITFFGNDYQFDDSSQRFVFSAGFLFGKTKKKKPNFYK